MVRRLEEMEARDVDKYDKVMKQKQTECAEEAMDEKLMLDEMTLASVLTACADLGDWRLGRWIEGFVMENNMEHNSYIGSALIDMYAKCGDLVVARAVFDRLRKRDVVNWNAMITGQALKVFHNMPQKNVVSWNAMISALALHGSAISSFGLVPKIGHYSCMVDLLVCAGHVHETWDFMMKMPGKPGEVVLGALLGACKRVRNVDIGERVMQLRVETEPSDSGNFIISP
ncbi:hypothetical protein Ancab_014562 [Ancistrocladus abbreviatus]